MMTLLLCPVMNAQQCEKLMLGMNRSNLASASLPTGLMIFAGGETGAASSHVHLLAVTCNMCVAVIAACMFGRWYELTACLSGDGPSSYVDMYNATSNSWTTYPTGLGQARDSLAAASLASGLVFFAGGYAGAMSVIILHASHAMLKCNWT